ncbi:hypothetical protein PM082_014126 [Marasmius tenuissimus]|nr:hypothetical protein PM082_014126 [Marasmius tenuissimus]
MFNKFALLAFVTAGVVAQQSGVTTRYWDCCKPSCSWPGKAPVTKPVTTCDKTDNPLSDQNALNGCDDSGLGTSFTCTNFSPFVVNDVGYGFAAVNLADETENDWCCACYELTFTSGPSSGKTMIVQATNTGGDLGGNQFDILIPGGGVGYFDKGCPLEFGSWNGGERYGGVANREQCSQLPASLVTGCQWRFDWFQGANNPDITFRPVTCPAELTNISGCVRQ